MWVFSLYTMVDGFFVAKYVGEHALAAVNLGVPFVNTLFAVAIIFGVGTQTIIGVMLGKGALQKAKETFSFTVVFITILSTLFAILCHENLDLIVQFLGATPDLAALVRGYLWIITLFSPFFIISYNFEVLVKVDGFPRLATLGVFSSALANILLDYIFVGILGWGIEGAAWATGLAQVLSTLIFLQHFLFRNTQLGFVRFKLNFAILKDIIPLGFGDFISEIGIGVVVFFYNIFIIRHLGEASVATFTVISYVNQLVCMTFVGITQGIQPLVSFYYGEKNEKAYLKLFKYALVTVFICSIIAMLIVYIFGQPLFRLFFGADDPQLIHTSYLAMKKFAPSFLIVGYNLLIAGFSSALLRARYSITINLLRGVVLIYASLFVLSALDPAFIWYASIVSEVLTLIVSLLLIRHLLKTLKNPQLELNETH